MGSGHLDPQTGLARALPPQGLHCVLKDKCPMSGFPRCKEEPAEAAQV